MTSALMYCDNQFKKALKNTKENKVIHKAFEALAIEIKKLEYRDQINLYSITTQFLECLVKDQPDPINPLEVFILRCDSMTDKNKTIRNVGLALGVIAIALSVVILGAAIGVGIGILLGLWQTPLVFMASLMAAETAPLIVASASASAGIGMGFMSRFLFFKEPEIKKSLNNCIEIIKQSHLSETLPSEHEGVAQNVCETSDETTNNPVNPSNHKAT